LEPRGRAHLLERSVALVVVEAVELAFAADEQVDVAVVVVVGTRNWN